MDEPHPADPNRRDVLDTAAPHVPSAPSTSPYAVTRPKEPEASLSAFAAGDGPTASPGPYGAASDRPARGLAGQVAGAADGIESGLREHHLAESLHAAVVETERLVSAVVQDVPERFQRAKDRVHHGIDATQAFVSDAAAETKARADAIGEAAQAAAEAPAAIASDVGKAAGAYAKGVGDTIAFAAAAGALGIAGLVVLTIGLVVGIDLLLGAPWGAFLTALLYAVAAFALLQAGKARRLAARKRVQAHMHDAKSRVDRVVRPARRAFSRRRVAPRTPR